ncbi:sensor histidine kinase [Embleya scabrispora]|uniref:sensor histidine kinase n=1 Tax=Embleya scabrispora TaxID=159449 RepID=UPI00037928F5|nr:HAMP domain-containing sensor histidine kinase [Embleya scabrispora]
MTGRPPLVRRIVRRVAPTLKLRSLRFRVLVAFALVALISAVAASGIAYWLTRTAVLERAQDSVLTEFRDNLGRVSANLPEKPDQADLGPAVDQMRESSFGYSVVLVGADGRPVASNPTRFPLERVPAKLQRVVQTADNNGGFHMYFQRIDIDGQPYLVGGTRVVPNGPTGYMFKSLKDEQADLNSLARYLIVGTLLALGAAAVVALFAARHILRPVRRLGHAARELGAGRLDTRLDVRGSDELADLSRTFNDAAEKLERSVAELRALESSSRRFVADVSHELRTPLAAMTAVSELLEEEADSLGEQGAPAARLVVAEIERLATLVEDLMEVSRFDAGTAALVADEVDITDLVTACLDARAWMDAVDLRAPRGILAKVDPRRLDVMVSNLVGNALRHGGSPVTVEIHHEPRATLPGMLAGPGEQDLVIEVSDTGPGIPEDVLPHVFDRFYKADSSRARSEGSGLGLSIVMENARIHGGTAFASNMPGGGAKFTLRLPLVPPELEEIIDPDEGVEDDGVHADLDAENAENTENAEIAGPAKRVGSDLGDGGGIHSGRHDERGGGR